MTIYLDNSATTRPLDAAIDEMDRCMRESYYNPSAAYAPAAKLERRVTEARQRLLGMLGHADGAAIYTSGGTESNNTAIFGALSAMRGNLRIVTSSSEHPSVYEVCRRLAEEKRAEVVFLPADGTGAVPMDALSDALTEDTSLVSLMQVNNETGAVTDIHAAYARIRRQSPGAVFHVDGVQSFCKLPFQPLPCDLYSISGHKLHGPKGVGALYVKKGLRFAGGLVGGGQEFGLRSGTVNAPGILGLDAALAAWREHQPAYIDQMRACKLRLYKNLSGIPDAVLNGPAPEAGAPQILNLSFPGVRGEVLLHALEGRGIFVATGSACSSHKKGKNRVLSAMGLPAGLSESAIRFSLCPFNTVSEMDEAANIIYEQVAFLRRYQRR